MASETNEERPIHDIAEKYPNRWVAMVVTLTDENMQPIRGRVVADDVDRYRLRQRISKFNDICIFYAGKPEYPLLL